MTTSTTSKPSFPMPPMSAEHQATQKVADRFYELCSSNQNRKAISELYSDDARHVEVMDMPGCSRISSGKREIEKKAEQFEKSTTVHGGSCDKPIVNGDQFVCQMTLDCTTNEGPMAGQRMNMSETALYTVKNGKITEGKFFYSCGG